MLLKLKTTSNILLRIGIIFILQALILLMISNYAVRKTDNKTLLPEITKPKLRAALIERWRAITFLTASRFGTTNSAATEIPLTSPSHDISPKRPLRRPSE